MKNPELRATMTASRRELLQEEGMARESNRMWPHMGGTEWHITGKDAVRTTEKVLRNAFRGTGTKPNHHGTPQEAIMSQAAQNAFETATTTIWAAVTAGRSLQDTSQNPEKTSIMLITAGLRAARTSVTGLLEACGTVSERRNGAGDPDLREFLKTAGTRWAKTTEDARAHMRQWQKRAGPKDRAPAPAG